MLPASGLASASKCPVRFRDARCWPVACLMITLCNLSPGQDAYFIRSTSVNACICICTDGRVCAPGKTAPTGRHWAVDWWTRFVMLLQKAEIISFTLCGVRAAALMRHLMKETFPYLIHLMAHELPLRLSNGLMEG